MIGALRDLLHPALLRLDPETAHGLTLKGLALWPSSAPRDDPRLAVEAFGLRFPNPLGVAAGVDKDAEVPDALLGLGFGFTEVGTLTPRPQPGNPRPRVFRLPADRALINRYGFNNAGHAEARARLAARAGRSGIVGVNIGTNKDAADRGADYVAGIAAFADLASYFTINVSSPNTPGLRDLQGANELDDLLDRVVTARDAAPRRVPLLLKIAPDLDEVALDDIVRVARARRIDGMIVSNTTIARSGLTDEAATRQAGGLSGPPLFAAATRVLAQTFLRAEKQFPLIGVGGVEDAATALAKIRAGATLLQLYTALVYKGPKLVGEVKRGLLATIAAEATTLAAEVGRSAGAVAR